MIFVTTFVILIIIAVSMLKNVKVPTDCKKNIHFRKLQSQYLLVYYISSFADWLQGPYVYKLYSDYGFSENEIALLYIIGFASSSVFGTIVGLLADMYGRKTLSASFGIIYSICCVTKLSKNFYVLSFGRLCGGISTSILFTTFEAWYICEHTNHYKLPLEWINLTLSKASFYSGLLAIVAGVGSQILVEVLHLGSASPFIIATPFLLTSTIIITTLWTEHSLSKNSTSIELLSPLKLIFKQKNLLLLGFIQSLYETTMYTFIFSWTPIISSLNPPLGLVFSIFMVAFMIGSKLYAFLISKNVHSEIILTCTSIVSFLSLSLISILIYIMKNTLENGYLESSTERMLTLICFFCFIVFEICVGIYNPAIGFIKGQIVPEEHRASVTNWFRVPMNIFTCLSLTLNSFHKQDVTTLPSLSTFRQFSCIYFLCSTFLVITLILTIVYVKNCTSKDEVNQNKESIKAPIRNGEFVLSDVIKK